MKRALITGITGRDGAYLAEFPLGKWSLPQAISCEIFVA
jgi:GDP-D-mannose dehydratase